MPHAKNTQVRARGTKREEDPTALMDAPVPSKTARIIDIVDDDEAAPEEKTEGAVIEEADGDETVPPEEEELDANELNPFGDKWEE